jgi:tetratricopeptide (TPR) repeat protein
VVYGNLALPVWYDFQVRLSNEEYMLKLKVLLLLVAFISTTACTEKQASTPAPTKAAMPVAKEVGPPIAIPLTDLPEAVVTLVEPLIKQAMNEPRNGGHRGTLGMAYQANGFPDAAFNSYQQAEDLASANARWPYYQALILAGRGEHQLAIDAVNRAMSLDESYAPLWMQRGIWLLDLARSIEALADFSKAETMGLQAAGLAGQARALLQQHKSEEALAILKPLARNAPFPSIYYLLGRAYRETGNMEPRRFNLATLLAGSLGKRKT